MEEFIDNFNLFRDQLYNMKKQQMYDQDTLAFIIGLFEGYNLHKAF